MADAEASASLAADLDRMSPVQRRQVLAALTPAEAETLERLLARPAEEPPAPAEKGFESHYSPWLAARLAEADAGEGAMTSAARQLALRLAREVADGSAGTARPAANRPSLLQLLLGSLRFGAAAR